MSEPKKWWAELTEWDEDGETRGYLYSGDEHAIDAFHVVEKSAYDHLKAKLEVAKEALGDICGKRLTDIMLDHKMDGYQYAVHRASESLSKIEGEE